MYADSPDLNLYETYNKHLRTCKGWLQTLKLLYVGHQLIDNIGHNFSKAFLSEYFEKVSEQTKLKNDIGIRISQTTPLFSTRKLCTYCSRRQLLQFFDHLCKILP